MGVKFGRGKAAGASMPYAIKRVKGGYKVCKRDGARKCFSKKPLAQKKAKKQLAAMVINTV